MNSLEFKELQKKYTCFNMYKKINKLTGRNKASNTNYTNDRQWLINPTPNSQMDWDRTK